MNPERWRKIEQIYFEALELEPARREELLDRYCAEDATLRTEVERLLECRVKAENFIESPAVEVVAKALFSEGAEISPYANRQDDGEKCVEHPAPVGSEFEAPDGRAGSFRSPQSKCAPWWVYAIAAVFLVCAAVRYYACFDHPDTDLGWTMKWAGSSDGLNGISIMAVRPGSMAAKAGVKVQGLPRIIAWLVVLMPGICEALFASIGVTFALVFPRRLFRQRWIIPLFWLPAAMLLPLTLFSSHPPVYSFPRWWPDWYRDAGTLLALSCWFAMAAFLVLNYRSLRSLNERRRIRLLVAGAVITLCALAPVAAARHLPGWTFISRLNSPPYILLTILCFLGTAFPVSVAYAILRHRLFDIRVLIRQGVRCAVARNALLSLVPIVAIVLAADLLLHRSQPLAEILSGRGVLYAVLAGGGLLLHLYRKSWLNALDRHFFREHYNAQQVLRNVIEAVRAAGNFEKVAPRVAQQVESALHPEFAAIWMRRPGESAFSIVNGGDCRVAPIAAGGRLMALVRTMAKPVEIPPDETGWPWRQLPREESDFLRKSRIEWLFPICIGEGNAEALLALGPKRSESPYAQEDQDLLQGITSSLALLLERKPSVVSDSGGLKECPECGTCYDSDSDSCKKEGAALTPILYPRLLARRYRFERRLGRGGMGVVYESFDTELDRHVAIKLVHPALTLSSEAAARFRQEAKVAASLTHPNVVTIYDFGVAEDGRAYLVMELLQGSTLRQELKRVHRLPASRACAILSGVCAAVERAHQRKLLHRDLKPENIFLADTERMVTPKILDFGVVKLLAPSEEETAGDQTEPGRLVGTLKYMSPEELQGEKPDESWDLWALGVVAYEMLTGAHPFTGTTSGEIRRAIIDGRMTPLHIHLPEAPQSLRIFFEKALAADPAERPRSAPQLLSYFMQRL